MGNIVNGFDTEVAGKILRQTEDRIINDLMHQGMGKLKLIKLLSQMIQQISDKQETELHWKEGKIKFRQYERMESSGQLQAIDVTIEI